MIDYHLQLHWGDTDNQMFGLLKGIFSSPQTGHVAAQEVSIVGFAGYLQSAGYNMSGTTMGHVYTICAILLPSTH